MSLTDLIELVTAVAAMLAAIASFINLRRVQEIHVAINSRMDALLKVTETAARAEGVTLGRRDTAVERNKIVILEEPKK